MQYNSLTIQEKKEFYNSIEKEIYILENVLTRNIGKNFSYKKCQPIWMGGGASIYIVKTDGQCIFLKVKKSSLVVESKLEEEVDFIQEPCLVHEKKMMEAAGKLGVSVPKIIFFDRLENYDFLATEYIEDDLLSYLSQCSIEEHLKMWNELRENVRLLFNGKMIHSDIHEYNIRCRAGKLYLVDFEESRYLFQPVQFDESLDVIGHNGVSTVGRFPLYMEENYSSPYNCLDRMKQVFNKYLAPKVFEYIQQCNYDTRNGICTSLDHGYSDNTYQEIKNSFFVVGGQRTNDVRTNLLKSILGLFYKNKKYTFVDIGSNNGLFCREISKFSNGNIRCIGLEGFYKFNILARGLAFLENCVNIEYLDFFCGKDSLASLDINGDSIFSICSVWHHIEDKEAFLLELKAIFPQALFLELATQNEVYGRESWEKELQYIREFLGFEGEYFLGYSADYNRPMILLTQKQIPQFDIDEVIRISRLQDSDYLENLSADELIAQYIDGHNAHNVVCFGAGTFGKRALNFLGHNNISFFIDNNPEKKVFEEHKVFTLDEAKDFLREDTLVVITTSSIFTEQIADQLQKTGFTKYITIEELLQNGLMLG